MLMPGLGRLLPVPFYSMELLVGRVQALVFMPLTGVFTFRTWQHGGAAARARTVDTVGVSQPESRGSRVPGWRVTCGDE